MSLTPYAPHLMTDREELRNLLKSVRLANDAVVDQELDIRLHVIAVPIRDEIGSSPWGRAARWRSTIW